MTNANLRAADSALVISAPGRDPASRARGIGTLEDVLAVRRRLPDELVLLGGPDPEGLRRAEVETVSAFRSHLEGVDPLLRALPSERTLGEACPRILLAEHEVFLVSFQELHELIALVALEDHGGNRQALGQYWRLIWEALRIHLADERGLFPGGAAPT